MSVAESVVLTLWRSGKNTADIARIVAAEEPWVCRVIAADQDRRHDIHSAAQMVEADHA